MPARLILIEFNELTPALVERFMADGDLPNFRAFSDAATRYITTAGNDPLEPWVQWPTVHCGVGFEEHGALHLGEGRRMPQPGIARILSDAGYVVGVLGMMNGNYSGLNGYYVPDPWDQRDHVQPAALRTYYDFVAKHVQENTRTAGVEPSDALRFAWFMLRHGLSRTTVVATLRQLIAERMNPAVKWRRAGILDLLQYDLFKHMNARYGVDFASFFSNSTAHLQHYFWRNMDDTGFAVQASAQDDPSLRDAIRYGYRAMDQLLGRIIADNPGALLVFCSALSQKAWYETTKCTYRPRDFAALLRFAGITATTGVRPVMAERFRVECATAADAAGVAARLRALRCRGEIMMGVETTGTVVYAGCDLTDADERLTEEVVSAESGADAHFGDLFYRITAMNSGRHDALGLLWVRNGDPRAIAAPIELTAVAPLVLRHFGVAAPETMKTPVPAHA